MSEKRFDLERILGRYPRKPEHLISVLQDIQIEQRWLPEDALREVGKKLGVPASRVYAVATFYKAFSLIPKGEKEIRVCLGTACHVRGGRLLLEEIERQLGVPAGRTTADMKFSLERVNCVGACAMAPVVIVNDKYYGSFKTSQVKGLLKGRI